MKGDAEQIAAMAIHGAKQMSDCIEVTCLDDVEMVPIKWLWEKYIALGKVTVIAGDPGLGKSQLSASITATVSVGGAWPDGSFANASGDVIILSAEDDPADTIKPRLVATGANVKRCHVIKAVKTATTVEKPRGFDLSVDIERLSALFGLHA